MPATVNTQITPIQNNEGGGFPDGAFGQYSPPQGGLPTIAAAGSTQATATALTALGQLTTVTAASGTNGIILPISPVGTEILVYSSAATNALLVYPPVGGAINNAAANASQSVAARKLTRFVALDSIGNYACTLSA